MISLLIPAYNEEGAIEDTVSRAHETLTNCDEDFEIIVINDGSTDGTGDVLKELALKHLTVIEQPQNRGYGASMKAGIRRSKGQLIATTDADGTYPIEDLQALLDHLKKTKVDMVVGARTKKGAQIPLIRRPAKAIMNALANFLTGSRIPDTNSGLRIFTRELADRFMHLYPQGFSFTLTITLAALTNDYAVEFVPITYAKRIGKSSLSSGFNGIRNFLTFLGLIIRIITYFRPMRFFAWPSALLLLAGIATVIYTIRTDQNISDVGMLLLLTGLQIGLFGLLAEVVVRYAQRK